MFTPPGQRSSDAHHPRAGRRPFMRRCQPWFAALSSIVAAHLFNARAAETLIPSPALPEHLFTSRAIFTMTTTLGMPGSLFHAAAAIGYLMPKGPVPLPHL